MGTRSEVAGERVGYNRGMMPFAPMGLPGKRTPRFRRVDPSPHQITERDLAIAAAVVRHSVLSSVQIDRLFPEDSRQQLRRRLKLLYNLGILEKPQSQTFAANLGAYHVYTPGHRVGRFVPGARPKTLDGALPHLLHALAVSDFLVSAEVACREFAEDGLTYLPSEHILRMAPLTTQTERMPAAWPVELRYGGTRKTFYVQPDGIFGIAVPGAVKFFMLEVDNGTMPVVRRTPYQTSLLRKLLAYAETHRAGIHQSRYGMGNMRTLFVVPNAERRETLKRAFREQVPGAPPQLFLVIDQAGLAAVGGNVLFAKWQDMDGVERLLVE